MSSDRPRLLLVGAGHAHMEVLRQQILDPFAAVVTLVSAGPQHHYSGMVPGYLAGTYREEEIAFDLVALTVAAGIEFIEGRATELDPGDRQVELANGRRIAYDLVSFNIGSRSAGSDSPQTSGAIGVKPMSEATRLRHELEELARRTAPGPRTVVVVGAGAAGVEVALAADRVLSDAGRERRVTLVEAADEILSGYDDRFRRKAERVLSRRGLEVVRGRRVESVENARARLEDGSELPAELAVWLTGAVGWPILPGSGLPTDDRGFLLVDDRLRSVADKRVWAVGDCGTMVDYPETPKAGVYAVRQAPVLAEGLRATLAGDEGPAYEPQEGFLSLLNTADGKALLRWKFLVSWSRWAWWLKDWIDRRFMRKYQTLADGAGSR